MMQRLGGLRQFSELNLSKQTRVGMDVEFFLLMAENFKGSTQNTTSSR